MSLQAVEEKLERDCMKLASVVSDYAKKVENSEKKNSNDYKDRVRFNLQVLEKEHELLEAQLPRTVVHHPRYVFDKLQAKLTEELDVAKTLATSINTSIAQMEHEVEEKSMVIAKQKALFKRADEQIEVFSSNPLQSESQESFAVRYQKDLVEMQTHFSKECEKYHQKMMSFLEEHFPEFEDTETGTKYLPLGSIIFELIRSLMSSPENPYIPIQNNYWLPHIELLLRYSICCRHPNDSTKIKLAYVGL